ncbi:MAG TPA: hypothetical protein DD409_03435 [Bacteroidales bacterium]|nr:hypothetical protein [Bacteroidales bacterium]
MLFYAVLQDKNSTVWSNFGQVKYVLQHKKQLFDAVATMVLSLCFETAPLGGIEENKWYRKVVKRDKGWQPSVVGVPSLIPPQKKSLRFQMEPEAFTM